MMDTASVGETAGKVWQFLDREGKSSVSAIEKGVDVSTREVLMSIGWLAREGKIDLSEEPRGLYITLR